MASTAVEQSAATTMESLDRRLQLCVTDPARALACRRPLARWMAGVAVSRCMHPWAGTANWLMLQSAVVAMAVAPPNPSCTRAAYQRMVGGHVYPPPGQWARRLDGFVLVCRHCERCGPRSKQRPTGAVGGPHSLSWEAAAGAAGPQNPALGTAGSCSGGGRCAIARRTLPAAASDGGGRGGHGHGAAAVAGRAAAPVPSVRGGAYGRVSADGRISPPAECTGGGAARPGGYPRLAASAAPGGDGRVGDNVAGCTDAAVPACGGGANSCVSDGRGGVAADGWPAAGPPFGPHPSAGHGAPGGWDRQARPAARHAKRAAPAARRGRRSWARWGCRRRRRDTRTGRLFAVLLV